MKNKFLVRDKKFYSSFFMLLIPIALQSLIAVSAGLIDNIMITNYSTDALAAIAVVNRMQFFLNSLIAGIGEGIVVISAQYWGRKNTERIKEVMGVGMRLAIVASLIMSAIVIFLPEQFMRLFSDDLTVIREGVAYMRIIGIGYLFFCPAQMIASVLRSVETVKIGFGFSVVGMIVNVFLNYCLIYGNFGLPRLGTAGAAIATIAGYFVEFCLFLIYILRIDKKLAVKFSDFLRFSMPDFKQFIRIATPMILSNSTWGIAMGLQTKFISVYGKTALSADSIAGNVFSVMNIFLYGSANAANVLIGKTIGEGKRERVPLYTRTLQILFVGFGLLTGALLFSTRGLFLSLYQNAPSDVLVLAKQFITVLSITSIGTAYQMACLTGIVRGGGDTKFVFYNDMVHQWLIILPLAAISVYVLKLPVLVVFALLKSDQILKCIVAFFKVNSFNWIKEVEA